MSSLAVNFLYAMIENLSFRFLRDVSPRRTRTGILRINQSRRACEAAKRSCLFAALGAVFTATALAAIYTERVQGAADDVISDAGEVADAAPSHEHDAVLLEVVLLA